MASSYDDENANQILMSPGRLVWVLRKDETWWPGRLLRPNEVSRSSSSSSQTSGAPVLLLGRGTFIRSTKVKWYNLRRKRQVRPFRCTSFAHWIEEAKESSKKNELDKRSKYFRRNQAILQALEIEEEWLHSKNVYSRDEDEDSSSDTSDSDYKDQISGEEQSEEEIMDISSDSEFLPGHDQAYEFDESSDELHSKRRRSERKRTQAAHVHEFLEMEKQALWERELVAKSTTTKPRKGLSPSFSTRTHYKHTSTATNATPLKIERSSTLVLERQQKGKQSSGHANKLYDVSVVATNNCPRPNVPKIRRMSRDNNYAIIGYPIYIRCDHCGKVFPEAVYQDKEVKKQLLKEKKLEGEVITCVPLNMVFNRINQAVDGKSAKKI